MACHTTSSLTTRSYSSAWTALTLHRPSTDSHTAPLQFVCSSCGMACSSMPTSRRLSSLAPLLSSGQLPTSLLSTSPEVSAGRIAAQVAWRDHRLQLAVRLPCEKRCEDLQLPHLRHAPRAQPSDRRRRPDSRVQHRRFEARLLQRPAMRSTGDDIRQTAARPEQPDQSRLPLPGSRRRQAVALVARLAPLASIEAAPHLQYVSIDPQSAGHSHSGVPQRPGTDPRTNSGSAFIRRSAAGRSPDTD